MNKEFQEIVNKGIAACIEHGFGFINIYQAKNEANVKDGWDRFIISPYHQAGKEYDYVGFVRQNGEFVGNYPK